MKTKKETEAAVQVKAEDETRYIVVFPQVQYNRPMQNGQYEAIDPLLTREQLNEKLPALVSGGGNGNGVGFRVYEVSRYVPVSTKVIFDGEVVDDLPKKKLTNAEKAGARQIGVSAASFSQDTLDYYDDEEDY